MVIGNWFSLPWFINFVIHTYLNINLLFSPSPGIDYPTNLCSEQVTYVNCQIFSDQEQLVSYSSPFKKNQSGQICVVEIESSNKEIKGKINKRVPFC